MSLGHVPPKSVVIGWLAGWLAMAVGAFRYFAIYFAFCRRHNTLNAIIESQLRSGAAKKQENCARGGGVERFAKKKATISSTSTAPDLGYIQKGNRKIHTHT